MISSYWIRSISQSNIPETHTLVLGLTPNCKLEGVHLAPPLMLQDTAKMEYERYRHLMSYQNFKHYIAPQYIKQIAHDSVAYSMLEVLMEAAQSKDLDIALVSDIRYESEDVRSVLIGILQGMGYLGGYFNNNFRFESDNFSDYFDLFQKEIYHS